MGQKLGISQHLFSFREGIPMCKVILTVAWEYRLQMPDKLKVLFTSQSQNMNFFSTFFWGGGGRNCNKDWFISGWSYWATCWPYLDCGKRHWLIVLCFYQDICMVIIMILMQHLLKKEDRYFYFILLLKVYLDTPFLEIFWSFIIIFDHK